MDISTEREYLDVTPALPEEATSIYYCVLQYYSATRTTIYNSTRSLRVAGQHNCTWRRVTRRYQRRLPSYSTRTIHNSIYTTYNSTKALRVAGQYLDKSDAVLPEEAPILSAQLRHVPLCAHRAHLTPHAVCTHCTLALRTHPAHVAAHARCTRHCTRPVHTLNTRCTHALHTRIAHSLHTSAAHARGRG
eukprot:1094949-Rhodomonas_salina.1